MIQRNFKNGTPCPTRKFTQELIIDGSFFCKKSSALFKKAENIFAALKEIILKKRIRQSKMRVFSHRKIFNSAALLFLRKFWAPIGTTPFSYSKRAAALNNFSFRYFLRLAQAYFNPKILYCHYGRLKPFRQCFQDILPLDLKTINIARIMKVVKLDLKYTGFLDQ